MLRSFKDFLIQSIISAPVCPNPYLSILERKEWSRVRRGVNFMSWPSGLVISAATARESLLQRAASYPVCHILASGHSLLESIPHIGKNDVIMGFNFAGLLGLDYDFFFSEVASDRTDMISLVSSLQHTIISSCCSVDRLYFKNIWEGNVDPEYVFSRYGKNSFLVQDISVPYGHLVSLNAGETVVRHLLSPDKIFLKQFLSSVLTCISLAIQAQFERIIVHGLDFGGGYFFQSSSFTWPSTISVATVQDFFSAASTTASPRNYQCIAPLLLTFSRLARINGSRLLAASPYSPSASYLGSAY